MGLPHSTFYAKIATAEEDPVVAEIHDIVAVFKGYGYRRVAAELRHRGMIVNSKKVRRIMREYGLNPKRKHRYVVTTDSNHDSPIYTNLAKGFEVHGPNQLWVGDITFLPNRNGVLLPRCHFRCLVSKSCWVRTRQAHRFAVDNGCTQISDRKAKTTAWLPVPLRSRRSICCHLTQMNRPGFAGGSNF